MGGGAVSAPFNAKALRTQSRRETRSSFLTVLNGDVTLGPANPAVNLLLNDAKALWQISKSRLRGYLLLGSASQRLGRKTPMSFTSSCPSSNP